MNVNQHYTDCRSTEGVTVGLVDAIISVCRVLRNRDLSPVEVRHALVDLCSDEDFMHIYDTAMQAKEAMA